MESHFTTASYQALLQAFQARRYAVVDYFTLDPFKAHLIVRHDIDMTLPAAIDIAEAESGMGVKASYFVLIGSEFYNPHSPESTKAIRRIAELGHRIGLHFDAAVYAGGLDELDAAAEKECAVLETISGAPVEMISFHRPATALLGLDRPLAGRSHAYQPRFFRDIAYCSDSRGQWQHGHPLQNPAVAAGKALQLLTHPVWWTSRAGETPGSRLSRFLDERARFLDQELAAHCSAHTAGTDKKGLK